MSDISDRLIAEELRRGLDGCWIGREIVVVEETASTNDLAWQALERGAEEGFVVFAESQTKGRGQHGRRWESAPHLGLWFSVLLRPAVTIRESPRITSLLAEAISLVITGETGFETRIKPPNDIYIADRKVAGLLVEGRTEKDGSYIAVAGIGINVNQRMDDFPEALRSTAGSLRMAGGKIISRTRLAIALLRQLDLALNLRKLLQRP